MSIGSYDTIVGEGKSGYVYQDPLMFNSTVLPISGRIESGSSAFLHPLIRSC